MVNDLPAIVLSERFNEKGIKLCLYILITFVLIISSCVYDPPRPSVEIWNKTDRNLTVELFFDKENYREWWSEHDFKVFLTDSYARAGSEQHKQLISTDTVNLVQRYSLFPDSYLSIDGWGDKDETVLFNKIKVIEGQDTIVYSNIVEIKKSSVRISRTISRLEIN
ncbi:hypothetical protein J7E50_25055 [Pedobacter sp. ISL-68]|uniref:hypothetical protein n=1 Tax=unclassified Pedobacter TaxID=2628915 RepID=UPI001BEA1DEA|nr:MULTISPECIES: hypothetical protein [unclassified Pedobacter]MBT2562928.1 hypothetical protein [Pedobacter sp. ISL-64]MBT2593515.1 hypothetical protein [Pedobacter sp. ISL-68]